MKLPAPVYRLVFDAHAWAGALASVLLVGMFLLGVVSLFHDELAPWQEPRLRAPVEASEVDALRTLQQVLDERAGPGAPRRIDIDLPSPHMPWLRLLWTDADGRRVGEWLHPATGEAAPVGSDLGEFLFLMHFLYPLPGGMLLSGIAGALLLLVVMSGLLLQLGRFWREALRFRPRESLRQVWGDLHKVLGSVGLPYQAMIAWTAAIIGLNAAVLQPLVVHTAYDGNMDAGLQSIGYPRGLRAAGEPGPAPDVATVLSQARASLPDSQHYRFSVRNLGDRAAYVEVRGLQRRGLEAFTTVRVDAEGQVRHVREAGGPTAAAKVLEGAYVVHSGGFAGVGVKLAYALLGVFGALCIVTGNLVWLERRAHARRRIDVLLARLTAGGAGGAAAALAAVGLANQLLPWTIEHRPEWEHAVFYAAWVLSVLGALAFPRASATAKALLGGSGVVLALLPLLDAALNARAPFDPSTGPLFWTDLGLVAFGASLVASAWVVGRLTQPAAAPAVALS